MRIGPKLRRHRFFYIMVFLAGIALLVVLFHSKQRSLGKNVPSNRILTLRSNQYQLHLKAGILFDKHTQPVQHLEFVKSTRSLLQKKRDIAFIRFLQETVDLELSKQTPRNSSDPETDNRQNRSMVAP